MVQLQIIEDDIKAKVNKQIVRKKKKSFVPINKLRNRALANLHIKEERVKFSNQEIVKINDLLQSFQPQSYEHYLGVIVQIERDIKAGYIKPDLLARWLDADSGLAKWEPDLIRNIAMVCGLGD